MRYVARYLIKNDWGAYLCLYWPRKDGDMSVWGPKSEALSYRDRAEALRDAKQLGERVIRCVRES